MKTSNLHEGESAEELKFFFSSKVQSLLNEKIHSDVYQFLATHTDSKKRKRDGAVALHSPFVNNFANKASYNDTKVNKASIAGEF